MTLTIRSMKCRVRFQPESIRLFFGDVGKFYVLTLPNTNDIRSTNRP